MKTRSFNLRLRRWSDSTAKKMSRTIPIDIHWNSSDHTKLNLAEKLQTDKNTSSHEYIYMHIHTQAWSRPHMQIYVCACACTSVCVSVCVYARVCVWYFVVTYWYMCFFAVFCLFFFLPRWTSSSILLESSIIESLKFSLSLSLSLYIYIYIYIYIYVCMYVYLSAFKARYILLRITYYV